MWWVPATRGFTTLFAHPSGNNYPRRLMANAIRIKAGEALTKQEQRKQQCELEKTVDSRLHYMRKVLLGPVHTTPEKFENATIAGYFGFVLKKTRAGKSKLSWRHRFRKAPFSKCFPSTQKRKDGVFKFLRFEERFRKAPFSWRIGEDGRPNRRN